MWGEISSLTWEAKALLPHWEDNWGPQSGSGFYLRNLSKIPQFQSLHLSLVIQMGILKGQTRVYDLVPSSFFFSFYVVLIYGFTLQPRQQSSCPWLSTPKLDDFRHTLTLDKTFYHAKVYLCVTQQHAYSYMKCKKPILAVKYLVVKIL